MAVPAYWLTFEARPSYLFVRVEGLTDSLETSIAFWQEIAIEANERGTSRLLVQEHFRNTISADEIREVGQFLGELAEQLLLENIKISFVDDRLDHLDSNRLGEEVATNHGVRCKVFTHFDEAEAWLLTN